jgi:hypothetical protein
LLADGEIEFLAAPVNIDHLLEEKCQIEYSLQDVPLKEKQ